ncbi:MAG: metallophosphoesterase [Phycisphaerae bacterium]|nr:metallophosphoesterase [Phycisphaerae bacterium]
MSDRLEMFAHVRVRRISPLLALALGGGLTAIADEPRGATVVSFQQGVNGYISTLDTQLSENQPAASFGTVGSMKWDTDDPSSSGRDAFALLRFDNIFGSGAGQIPPGASIVSALLTYDVFNGGDPGSLYDALVPWDETTTYNTFGGTPGVQASEWGKFADTAQGYTVARRSANVTASLQRAALNPAAHFGWIVLPSNSDGVEIRSSEYSVSGARPALTVAYTLDPTAVALLRKPYLQKASPTSIVIAWRTNTLTDSRVRYGSAPDALTQQVADGGLKHDHAITLSDLQPGATYFYDVGTSAQPLAGGDAAHTFTMPPAPTVAPPLRIWVVGDSGSGDANQLAVRNAMLAYTAADPPDFALHMGDIVYPDGTDSEYTSRYFTPYENILNRTVCWPTHGNHDGHSANSDWPAGAYYEAFTLPAQAEAGGVPSGTEAYYSFDYANVHFICLNSYNVSNAPGSAMLTWLAADLAATQKDWVVAYWHHPPYTRGSHDSDSATDSDGAMIAMRQNVVPILEAGGVDLVLCGHSHGYERSFLVDGAYDTPTTAPGHIVDGGDGRPSGDGAYLKPRGLAPRRGAVYVVNGHCGAGLSGTGGHPLMYRSEFAFGCGLLSFDGFTLSFENLRADGVITDTFQIRKIAAGDMQCDGVVTVGDIGAFVLALTDPQAFATQFPQCAIAFADMNGDGAISVGDIGPFVQLLVGE